jgi:pimeloyl-ACP methyl ester carboxylesterase
MAEAILAMPISDEQADIMLGNRYTATKLGWEPRWHNPSLQRWLHRISVPTLVVWGENDKLFPAVYAKRWGELIPNAKVEIIPECGHIPPVEKPDVTAKKFFELIGRS